MPTAPFSIVISGNPNDFTVRIGIGKWLQHLGVAALETLLISELFLVRRCRRKRMELGDRGQPRQADRGVRQLI